VQLWSRETCADHAGIRMGSVVFRSSVDLCFMWHCHVALRLAPHLPLQSRYGTALVRPAQAFVEMELSSQSAGRMGDGIGWLLLFEHKSEAVLLPFKPYCFP